jgi:hypothetical protein
MSTEYDLLRVKDTTVSFSEHSNLFSLDILQTNWRNEMLEGRPYTRTSVEIGPMEMEQVSEFLLKGIQAFWYWSTKEQQAKFLQGLEEIRRTS